MNLTEIKIMIEAEATRRQAARDGFDLDVVKSYLNARGVQVPPISSELPAAPAALDWHYFEQLNYRQLVVAAYVHLLRRSPDEGGLHHWTMQLAQGEEKAFVVGRLAYSTEGRAQAVPVQGLRRRYLAAAATHVPVLGPLLTWVRAFVTLHRRARAERAFQQHMFAMLQALSDHAVRNQNDLALRVDALRHVIETRP